MAALKLIDEAKAGLFSFSPECKTTEQAQKELTDKGWDNAGALAHVDAAIRSGAYAKADTTYAERPERVTRAKDAKAETEEKE